MVSDKNKMEELKNKKKKSRKNRPEYLTSPFGYRILKEAFYVFNKR